MPPHQPFDAETLEAFDQAQRKTIAILGASIRELREGQSEVDVGDMVKRIAGDHGFSQWYHEPEVRFGATLDKLHRASAKRTLSPGTLLEIDLAPATDNAYGDAGAALAFGVDREPTLVSEARELCRSVVGFASRWKTVGELYVYAKGWATNHRMSLGDGKAVGHVVLAREGLLDSVWPQGARVACLMRRNQIQWYNPRRLVGAYAVRPRLVHEGQGLAFEEMVYVDGEVKRILGRDSLAEVGTY